MPDSQLGRIIAGRYRLDAVLGQGGMGVVYRASQLDVDGKPMREVAVKMIRPDAKGTLAEDLVRRFRREARAASRLRSPYTVTVYDFGSTEDGELYYVMEFVGGASLEELLRQRKTFSPEEVVVFARQICEALEEAHEQEQPIIHRDLKPANVFVVRWPERPWVKVADFGVAKIVGAETSQLTAPGAPVGTPLYMSPEQWRGASVDARADLYALGVLLHQLLTGRPPFEGEGEPASLMYKHMNDPPPPLPEYTPDNLRRLVGRLLAKKARDRPRDARSVVAELDGVGPARRRRRHRRLVSVAAAILIGVSALVYSWQSARRSGSKDTAASPGGRADVPAVAEATIHGTVSVPAGTFFMGCDHAEVGTCGDGDEPGKKVYLAAFRIDRTEVTVAEYRACVRAGGCSEEGLTTAYWARNEHPNWSKFCNWGRPGRENHPINCVTWDQANAYCRWGGKRLPSETEWEKAARGTDGRKYPWGNEGYRPGLRVANIADESAKRDFPRWQVAPGYDDGYVGTAPVGSYGAGASPYGALDMIGNVSEWVDNRSVDERPLRGGSWQFGPESANTSSRLLHRPEARYPDFGFRCAE